MSISNRLIKEASPITRMNLGDFGVEQADDYEKRRYLRKNYPNMSTVEKRKILHPRSSTTLHPKTELDKLRELLKIEVSN